MAFLSASCLICERILRETDNALSVIRLVNIFSIKPLPLLPVEQLAAPVFVLGIVQFSPEDDANHTFSLTLIRPDGEESHQPLMTEQPIPLGPVVELPRTIHLVMQLGIVPRQFGVHQVVIKVDGNEAARTQFVLRLIPDDPNPGLPIEPIQALQ